VGVERSAPDASGARRVVLRENDFPGIRKVGVGPKSILAMRSRCAPIAGRSRRGQTGETPHGRMAWIYPCNGEGDKRLKI
jgi:hypothetical protein